MADWDEVKRLAADFQRAQLSSTVQRLSERNCIEIVGKLLDLNLIEPLIYTTDGKEYLTNEEVTKEIREELIVQGGRANLVELQQALNIDFSHIESKVGEIVKNDRSLRLVLGQLIDKDYIEHLAEEINDKLQEQGQITIAELTKQYDLPADFLSEVINSHLGTVIQGQVDDYNKDVIFTGAYVNRFRSKVRGLFSAVTRPMPVSNALQQLGLQERIFYSILEELVGSGRLAGSIAGGRQDKASFIPDSYTKAQNEFVDSFLSQNGYLEYDSLSRLGIGDAKSFIKKRFTKQSLVYLSSCAVGSGIIDQLEASIEEGLSTVGWIDVMPVLPSILSKKDAIQLLQQCLKKHPSAHVLCDTIVTSDKFITDCTKVFDELMVTKAEKDSKLNAQVLSAKGAKTTIESEGPTTKEDKKDARRKKAAVGKAGGGTQGRESKTKSVKKKYKVGRGGDDDSDDEASTPVTKSKIPEIEFMKPDEIERVLAKHLENSQCEGEFISEVAQQIYRPLKKHYQEVVKSVFLQSSTASGTTRKKAQGELQEKINGLWTNVKLFEKGLKLFNDDLQGQLSKHLLKTVCTEIVNMCLSEMAADYMMTVEEGQAITPEMRVQIIAKLSDPTKSAFSKLHLSLNGKSMDDFNTELENVCGPDHLGILLRKPDKKKERQLVFNHRQSLIEQLKSETDAAMCLHLATTVLLQIHTQCMVHAPGRLVPQLLIELKSYISEEHHKLLCECQDLVIKQIKQQSSGDLEDSEIKTRLAEIVPKLPEIVQSSKKTKVSEEN